MSDGTRDPIMVEAISDTRDIETYDDGNGVFTIMCGIDVKQIHAPSVLSGEFLEPYVQYKRALIEKYVTPSKA